MLVIFQTMEVGQDMNKQLPLGSCFIFSSVRILSCRSFMSPRTGLSSNVNNECGNVPASKKVFTSKSFEDGALYYLKVH